MTGVLLFMALLLQDVSVQPNTIVIRIAGEPSAELRRGIDFGAAEMAHTAKLMGREVTVTDDSSAAPTAMIVASGSSIPSGESVTRIHVGPLPSGAEACEFSVAPAERQGPQTVVWDATLSKYGASELNERFDRKYVGGMTAEAYLGWVAVKALVEAELRRNSSEDYCKALGRLRFDGHKGGPLFFDPATRTLSQPLYIVKNGRIVGEIK